MKKVITLGILGGFFTAVLLTKPGFLLNLAQSLTQIKKSPPPKEKEIPLSPTPEPTALPQKLDIDLLNDSSLEGLEVDGQTYSFAQGKIQSKDGKVPTEAEVADVAQLVFFYLWTKEDPLFTAPGYDPKEFKKTVEILKYLEAEYNKIIKRDEHFFPVSFLEKITGVFLAEHEFLTKPSDKTAQQLLATYQETAAAYQKEAERFWQTIKTNEAKIPTTNYIAFNSFTTKKIMLTDVEKVSQNGKYLLEEIEKRKKCLENGQNCQRATSKFLKPQTTEPVKEEAGKTLPLAVLFPLVTQKELTTLKGPYLVRTSCFGWGENFTPQTQPFYLLQRKLKISEKGVWGPIFSFAFKLATNNFYRKVAKNSYEEDFKTDLEYTSQSEDNSYTCHDPQYQIEAATLDYFWQNFRNKKLFNQIKSEGLPAETVNFVRQGWQFEEKFFSTTPPSFNNLEALASYYADAYKSLPTDKNNAALKEEFLKRYLLVNRRLGNFPLVANKGVGPFIALSFKEKSLPGFTLKDAFFYAQVYLSRSLWTLFYFPFSASVWRHPENLEYLEKREIKTISENGPYLDYRMALKKFSKEDVKRMHQEALEYNFKGVEY